MNNKRITLLLSIVCISSSMFATNLDQLKKRNAKLKNQIDDLTKQLDEGERKRKVQQEKIYELMSENKANMKKKHKIEGLRWEKDDEKYDQVKYDLLIKKAHRDVDAYSKLVKEYDYGIKQQQEHRTERERITKERNNVEKKIQELEKKAGA